MPKRVQLKRQAGWRMPENTMKVDRTTRWGNPFRVGDFGIPDASAAVKRYEEWLDGRVVGPAPPDPSELRGKNLACWCPHNAPCHAIVLLRRANAA